MQLGRMEKGRIIGQSPIAKFIVTDGGDIVDWHRIVVSARQATYSKAGGPLRQSYAGVDFSLLFRDYAFG